MAMYEYHPVKAIHLGKLPENDGKPVEIDVRAPLENIGVTRAREVLIYTFVTTRDDSEQFQRGYYEMHMGENDQHYKKYMNVATGPGITTIDSANLWFPMGDGKLRIKLIHPGSKKISIKNPLAAEQWSDIFLTGYRN